MRMRNLYQMVFLTLLAVLMIMVWNMSATAQTRDTDDRANTGRTGTYGSSSDNMNMGMTQFLIAVPRTSSYSNCEDQIKKIASEVKVGTDGRGMTPRSTDEGKDRMGASGGTYGGSTDQGASGGTDNRGTTGGTYGGTDQGADGRGTMGSMGSMNRTGVMGWEWGCSTDDKTVYILTRASSEQAALRDIPESMRNGARVIRLSQFSEMGAMNQGKTNEQYNKDYNKDMDKSKTKSGTGK